MLEVCEGPRERETSLPDDAVWALEVEPLHSVGVRFVGGLLGLLVGDLVAHPVWGWATARLLLMGPQTITRLCGFRS